MYVTFLPTHFILLIYWSYLNISWTSWSWCSLHLRDEVREASSVLRSEAWAQELRQFFIPAEKYQWELGALKVWVFLLLLTEGLRQRRNVNSVARIPGCCTNWLFFFLYIKFYCPKMMGALFYCSLCGSRLHFVLLTEICLFLPLFLYNSPS